MTTGTSSARAAALASELSAASERVVALLSRVPPERWAAVPAPGVWSIGKDAEHIADASTYHQWIVLMTLRRAASSTRPPLERARLTTELAPDAAIARIRARIADGIAIVGGLTDDELDRPTRPQRAGDPSLADTIARVMIGHLGAHAADIEAKLG